MAEYGRQLFLFYAKETWSEASGLEKDALDALNASGGFYSTYRAVSLRLVEIFGLLALAEAEFRDPVAQWLRSFFETNPGASQPMSDRWAVSLIPAAVALHGLDPDRLADALRGVTRWTCDYYDGKGLGLASWDADPQQEVDYLLGGAFEHLTLSPRDSSYIAAVVLDLASAFELADVYDDARNDFLAVGAFPIVPTPRDDVDQYKVAGADVPLDTAPKYAEEWRHGDGWRTAPHHRAVPEDYFLGRISRPWDQLAVSAITRDRHWVTAVRTLMTQVSAGESSARAASRMGEDDVRGL